MTTQPQPQTVTAEPEAWITLHPVHYIVIPTRPALLVYERGECLLEPSTQPLGIRPAEGGRARVVAEDGESATVHFIPHEPPKGSD